MSSSLRRERVIRSQLTYENEKTDSRHLKQCLIPLNGVKQVSQKSAMSSIKSDETRWG